MYLNSVGSGEKNGIDKNNINEARRQFMAGTIRASQKDRNRPDSVNPFLMASSSGLAADNIDTAPRPLRDSHRIPVLIAMGATIYACVGALREHLGMSDREIRDLEQRYGGLTMDILDRYSDKQREALEATYELDEAA
jgi:hypothetical protein